MQGITLTRYMMELSRANPHLSEIESLMNSIQTACKVHGMRERVGWDGRDCSPLLFSCFNQLNNPPADHLEFGGARMHHQAHGLQGRRLLHQRTGTHTCT